MKTFTNLLNPAARRAHRAFAFASPSHALRMSASAQMPELPDWVEDAIFNIYVGSPDPAIAVTEEGFITMALLRSAAVILSDGVVIPGYDDEGTYGYMVFQRGVRPFHSRASTARLALVDARRATVKAARLEAHFGDRPALKRAAERAAPFSWCTLTDARSSGLCDWGVETFLRRYGLWSATHLFGGMPKCVIWFGGGYVRRVVAAAVMRRENAGPRAAPIDNALDTTMAKLMLRNRAELEHHSHAL
jgi:hypothetical protein